MVLKYKTCAVTCRLNLPAAQTEQFRFRYTCSVNNFAVAVSALTAKILAVKVQLQVIKKLQHSYGLYVDQWRLVIKI